VNRRAPPVAAALAAILALLGVATSFAAGPPFPSPKADQSIYDPDKVLRPATVTTAERTADGLVASIGLRPIVYVERSPAALSAAQARRNADALIRQWKIDRGLVMLIDVGANGCGGLITVRRGSGVDPAVATDAALDALAETAVEFLTSCDPDTAVLVGLGNLNATLISISIGSPVSPGASRPPLPSSSGRPAPTPRGSTVPAGPPFPDPVNGRYVYDQAGVFRAGTSA
jgi:hypothetical protein